LLQPVQQFGSSFFGCDVLLERDTSVIKSHRSYLVGPSYKTVLFTSHVTVAVFPPVAVSGTTCERHCSRHPVWYRLRSAIQRRNVRRGHVKRRMKAEKRPWKRWSVDSLRATMGPRPTYLCEMVDSFGFCRSWVLWHVMW